MLRKGFLVGVLAAGAATMWINQDSELERSRKAYQAFINNHPYTQPGRVHPSGPPGLDSPGAAAEHEFIRTVDPALGTIPTQRLFRANEIGLAQIRSRGAANPQITTPWTERGPDNIGGRTRAILFDPNDISGNRVWAGGVSGGLWSTSDITVDGTPWVKQNDFWENLAVTAIDFDPTNTMVFYVGTGEGYFNIDAVQGGGIFKTTNGGTSFTRLASTDPTADSDFRFVQDVVVTGGGTVLASTRHGGLKRSIDGGVSWNTVLGNGIAGATTDRASDLELDANGDIYASLGIFSAGGVWKSIDDGATWVQQTLPFPASGNPDTADDYFRIEICTAPSDADTVYAMTHSADANNVNHVFRSTDGGAIWESRTVPTTGGQAWYDLICAVDPNVSTTVYLGVQLRLQRSVDGGGAWSRVENNLHPDFHGIVFRPGSSTDAVIGHDGGVDYTSNFNSGTPSYTDRNDGYNVTQYYGGDLSPTSGSNNAVAGSQDNSTHYFDSVGIDTTTSPSPLNCCDGGFAIVDQLDANFAVGSIQFGGMARSFDGGASFGGNAEGIDLFVGLNAGLFIPNLAFDDANKLLFSSLNQTNFPDAIFRISAMTDTNVLPTLEAVTIPIALSSETSTHSVSPYSAPGTSTVLLGTTTGQILRATGLEIGGTVSATDITGTVNPGFISSIEFGQDEQHILVTVSNFGVVSIYETLDGGAVWAAKQGDLPDMPVRWALYNANDFNQVLLATDSGLWETLDISAGSPQWTRVPGFPTVRVDQLQTRSSDQTIYAFTHGRGAWSASWRDLDFVFSDSFESPL